MPQKWSELSQSYEFKALPPEEQEKSRAGFFEQRIAPYADPERVPGLRKEWDARTRLPRPAAPAANVAKPDANVAERQALARPASAQDAAPRTQNRTALPTTASQGGQALQRPGRQQPTTQNRTGIDRVTGGSWDALKSGAQTTMANIGLTLDAWKGDTQSAMAGAMEARDIAKTPEQRAFTEALAGREETDSIWGEIKNVGAAAIEEPVGALHEVVAQTPNSGTAMAGMYAGAKMGSKILSPLGMKGRALGAFVGGVAGAMFGTSLVETGAITQEKAADGQLTEQELSEATRQGATKSAVIGTIDRLTMGVTGFMFSRAGRQATEAATEALARQGVDVTSEEAVRQALSDPATAQMLKSVITSTAQKANTAGRRVGRGATGMALESTSEGLGEYFGSSLAGLDPSVRESVLEGLMSMPQSTLELLWSRGEAQTGTPYDQTIADQERMQPGATPGNQGTPPPAASGDAPAGPTPTAGPTGGEGAAPPGDDRPLGRVSRTGVDQLIDIARKMGFEEEATRLGTFKKVSALADRLYEEGNVDAAMRLHERAERIHRDIMGEDSSLIQEAERAGQQLPAVYTYEGAVEGTTDLAAAAPGQQQAPIEGELYEEPGRLPAPPKRLTTDGVIYAGDGRGTTPPPADQPGDAPSGRLQRPGQPAPAAPTWADPAPAEPATPEEPRPVLQNRNRSSQASIEQMASIAANPDYTRLGFSRDFANGAPVVEPGAQIRPEQLGREDVAATAGGRRIPVQYAVVEADQLLPSNRWDGSRIPEYEQGLEGVSRTIAGNGRAAGLQRAYDQGNADGYREGIAADSSLHGIPAEVLAGMQRPVLVRLMPREEITDNIGDESNTTGTAALSPGEQARNDTRRVDVAAVELDDNGEPTQTAVEQFIATMPAAERAGLMDGKRPNRQAYDRLSNAVFANAYESDELLRLAAEATDPEVRTIMAGLKIAAGKMSRLKGAGSYDIRGLVVEAAEAAINAKRAGESLREFITQGDMGRNPAVVPILEMMADNIRSAKRIGENLSALADVFYAEANLPAEDMFGAVQKRAPGQLLDEFYDTNTQAGQPAPGGSQNPGSPGEPRGPEPAPGGDDRQATVGGEPNGARQPEEGGGQPAETEQGASGSRSPEQGQPAEEVTPESQPAPAGSDNLDGQVPPPGEFTLSGETEAEREAREKAGREAREAEEKARREAEEKARKEKEAQDDKTRADETVDNFELGQSAAQQLSGQAGMFDAPADPVAAAAADAATSPTNDTPAPTEGQIEAGNYKKGHVRWNGLDIAIENPAGTRRQPEWPELNGHYGYIKRTEGADGEHVDVFLNPDENRTDKVVVIDQYNGGKKSGGFDEHKIMLGYPNKMAAINAYKANYTRGWQVGPATEMGIDEFKAWLRADTTQPVTKPASDQQFNFSAIIRNAAGEPFHVNSRRGTRANVAPFENGKPSIHNMNPTVELDGYTFSDEWWSDGQIVQGRTEGKKPAPAEAAPAAEQLDASEQKPADPLQDKLDDIDAEIDAAAAELADLLKPKPGTLNTGVDPQILVVGARLGALYVQKGVVKFAQWSRAIVAKLRELGVDADQIKPHLKEIYAATQQRVDDEQFDQMDDGRAVRRADLDAILAEGEAQAETAPKEQKPAASAKPKINVKGGTKRTLTDDFGVESIDGRDENSAIKKQFLKEAKSYLNAAALDLSRAGFEPNMGDKKSKSVSVNEGGVAGSGEVSLAMKKGQVQVYARISGTSLRGAVPTTKSGVAVLSRVSTSPNDRFAARGDNHWLDVGLTSSELAAELMAQAEQAESSYTDTSDTGEDKDGVQDAVPVGDAGAGTKDLQPAAQDGGTRRPPAGEVRGSTPSVSATDGQRTETTERVPEGAVGTGGRKDGAGDTGRVPTGGQRGGAESATDAADRVTGANYFIEPGALEESRGPTQKARDNIRAIELMREIEAEGRHATHAEQQELARYVGWGGLKGAFPDAQGNFAKGFEAAGRRLQELLTETEYATARRSLQYAHYTAENVVRAMWSMAQRMGFDGGKVFEPGMGVGNFPGMMPADLSARTDYNGLELDHTTARIARLLYPAWGVRQDDFTKAPLPRDTYDLVIGNPPFADVSIQSDQKYPQGFLLHDYFFAKSLDAVRPGGLLIFISSAGTMNKGDTSAREYMADRADLVAAVRLPGTAFQRSAGTSVTTDIIVLRKKVPGEEFNAIDGAVPRERWVETTEVTLPNKEGVPTRGRVNRFFVDNPSLVLGEEGFFDPLYEGRYGVRAAKDFDLDAALAAVMDRVPRDIMGEWQDTTDRANIDFGTSERKEGSFYIGKDGELMQQASGVGVPVQRRGKGVTGGKTKAEIDRIQALVPVRDALRAVYAADLNEDTDNAAKARERLNQSYDAFVAEFGPINKVNYQYRRPTIVQQESARATAREEARYTGEAWSEGTFDAASMLEEGASLSAIASARKAAREAAQKAGRQFDEGSFDPDDMPDVVIEKRPNIDPFMDDPESYRLRAIEKYDDSTGEASKSAVFFENILTKEREPEINSVNDAVLYVLNQHGRLDITEVARSAGVSESEAIEQLGESIYRIPGTQDQWVTADEYLSGNVRRKLRQAKAAELRDPAMRRNVEALEAAIPDPLPPSEINANLGMPWIPTADIEQFATEAMGLEAARVSYTPSLGLWAVSGDSDSVAAVSTWGTNDKPAPSLLQDALNRQDPRVYRKVMVDGKESRELDAAATEAAQDKVREMKARFSDWIWSDQDRAERLATLYNEEFNNLVVREFDGTYLTTPGISSEWSWRPHQKRVIARIIQSGNTYMAHSVGAGKTSAMIGAGMEMRRLGLVRKPMYVVPNHMLGQFTKEFYEQYPTARIAVADERRFHTSRRKQFIANVASEDLDAIIITHSAFGMIPVSDEFQDGLIQQQIDDYREILEDTGNEQENRITRSRLEKQIERLEQRLSGRGTGRKDQVFTFEEMGSDFLFVDEAHMFRKLDFATKMSNVKGISPEGSKASWDLFVKTRYLETVNPGRNLVLASGTPVTNTMAELYTVSRYIQQSELDDRGLAHFDAWAGTYGDTVTNLEQDPAGGYKPTTRFAKFVNVPELSAMVRQNMDVVTSKQLEQYVTRPAIKGGKRKMNLAEKTEALDAYQATLASRMEDIANRKGPPKPGDDIILSVINDGRHAAIDMRLVDPDLPSDPGSKLNLLVDNVYRIWKETKRQPLHRPEQGGYSEKPVDIGPATQMVFANLGLSGARGFAVPDYIRSELARRGVPKNQIAYIADYKTHVAKQRLFNDMNEGKVRVLIGSTAKMATGVNAQRRLYALHNLDPLWFPADDEQRIGRALRQGNMNPEIEINDYSTKGTYDSTMWGMMETKARFIQGFFEGDPTLRDMDDLGEASQYEQAKALTTADPRLIELTDKRQNLERAYRRKQSFEREQYSLQRRVGNAKDDVRHFTERSASIRQDIEQRQDTRGDAFSARVEGRTFTDRVEAGDAIMGTIELLVNDGAREHKDRVIGSVGGFELMADVWGEKGRRHAALLLQRNGGHASEVSLSESARGTVQSIEAALRGFESDLAYAERRIESARRDIEQFEPQLDREFSGQDEIDRLSQEVSDLEADISADQKEKPEQQSNQKESDGEGAATAHGPGGRREAPRGDGSAPAFSRSVLADGLMGVDEASRNALEIHRRLGLDRAGVGLEVVATEADLPDVIRRQAEQDGATGQIEGVFHNKTVYVVASSVRSEAHLEEIIAHEGLGHFGARKLFGKDIAKHYDQLFFQLGGAKGMRSRLEARGIDFSEYLKTAERMGSKDQAFYLTDEFLAHMQQAQAIEALPEKIRRIASELYGKLREWARSMGMTRLAEMSDADLALLLRRMRQSATSKQEAGSSRPALIRASGAALARGGNLQGGNKGSAWTDDRVSSLIEEYAYPGGKSKGAVTIISPSEFLAATTGSAESAAAIREESSALDADELRNQVQPIFLIVEQNNSGGFSITGHEGRHRMAALDSAGVESVPVVLRFPGAIKDPQVEGVVSLSGQKFSEGRSGKDIHGSGLVMLMPEKAAAIKAMMPSDPDVVFSRARHPFALSGNNPSDGSQTGVRAQSLLARHWDGEPASSAQAAIREALRTKQPDVADWLRVNRRRIQAADRGDIVFSRAADTSRMRPAADGLVPGYAPEPEPAQGEAPLEGGSVGADADWVLPSDTKMSAFTDKWLYRLQNKQVDLKRVQQAIRATGREINEAHDAYLKEELFHGRSAARVNEFLEGELEPLIADMAARGVSQEELGRYLWARHAKEANAHIADINPEYPDGGSGMTDAEADAYMADLSPEQQADFEALAARVDAMVQKTRDDLVNDELISAQEREAWESTYQFYVPLFRENEAADDGDMLTHGMGTGQGYSIKGAETKRRTGSALPVADILGNIANARDRAIVRGEKARVGRALYALALTNKNPDFWQTTSQAPLIKTHDKDGSVIEVPDPLFKQRDNVVVVKLKTAKGNVVERAVVFNKRDERAMRMAHAVKNLDGQQLGELLGTTASVTRYFAQINTQYNPIFGVVNLVRDTQAALVNLSSTPLAGRQGAVASNMASIIGGALKNGGRRFSDDWMALAKEFEEAGGKTGYRDMFASARERTEDIQKALDPEWWTNRPWGKALTANGYLKDPAVLLVDKGVKPVFDWLSDYNDTLENATRLAVYKEARDQGLSMEASASIAKNITTNFNRKGELALQAGALFAFFNAAVQGTARVFETVAAPAGRRILAGGIMVGVMQGVMMALAGYDDDEPPQFVRERNLIFPIPGSDGKYLSLAMPLGFHVLPNLGRLMVETVRGGRPAEKIGGMMAVLADAFNPLGGSAPMAQILAPTAADPFVALSMNEDWTGKPIAREDFSSLNPTPGFTRSRDLASAPAVALAKLLNAVTGGTDYRQGLASPTGDQIDYLVGQLTGGIGREAIKTATTVTSMFTADELPAYKIPLLGRFYGETTGQASEASRFYSNIKRLNEHQNTVKGLRGDRKGNEAMRYLIEHPEARLFDQGNRAYRQVQKLRKQRSELADRGASKARLKQVDQQITRAMAQLNERMAASG